MTVLPDNNSRRTHSLFSNISRKAFVTLQQSEDHTHLGDEAHNAGCSKAKCRDFCMQESENHVRNILRKHRRNAMARRTN